MKIKLGDRIRIARGPYHGKEGKVLSKLLPNVKIVVGRQMYLIEFDEKILGGHSGQECAKVEGIPEHCWWVPYEYMEAL